MLLVVLFISGWHICRTCEKTSHFMCYTCTYALCKGCIREGDFLCVRENKGFCPACMKLAMLCENKEQATNESVRRFFCHVIKLKQLLTRNLDVY